MNCLFVLEDRINDNARSTTSTLVLLWGTPCRIPQALDRKNMGQWLDPKFIFAMLCSFSSEYNPKKYLK